MSPATIMTHHRRSISIPLIASGLYVLWALIFIYRSSFIAIDGERYFSLFDNAMISMRYAWNLAHGQGLVWNAGEWVEGYSNPLMTALMSMIALLFDRKIAVLVVQLLGIPTVLACAFAARRVAFALYQARSARDLFADLIFLSALLYYPLSFWTLMGVETGLLTLLLLLGVDLGLRWMVGRQNKMLYASAAIMGLAFLTRNEAVLPAGLLFGFLLFANTYQNGDRIGSTTIIKAGLIYSLFIVIQIAFRWAYYGQWVSNTYVLKIAQVPLAVRVNNGLFYSLGFLLSLLMPFALTLLDVFLTRRHRSIYLFLIPLWLIIYQVWIGGDVFSRWRFLVPAVPFLFISSIAGIEKLTGRLADQSTSSSERKVAFLLLTMAGILMSNLLFLPEALFLNRPAEVQSNNSHVNLSIAISEMTGSHASIGVFTAGVIPYYSGRPAIDFLGKTDPYIANLSPRLPAQITWFKPALRLDYNKYDLDHSIKQIQPTYIQGFRWGGQDLSGWVLEHYAKIEYRGKNGNITLLILKNSPLVNWEKGIVLP
jgi:hypothetical protein